MSRTLHVVSVGPIAASDAVCEALLEARDCRLSLATSYCDLWKVARDVDVVLFRQLLFARELREPARFVRHNWPNARILVVCETTEDLQDALYDEQLLPDEIPKVLIAAIESIRAKTDGTETLNKSIPSPEADQRRDGSLFDGRNDAA